MSTSKGNASKADPPRSKVVIRRLPPTLPEETFWKSVENWVSDKTCLWRQYINGRAADTNDGHAVFSRAYVLLSTSEAVTDLHRGYDGHVFRAKTGEEFHAVVELAPVQKTPYKAKVKVDARQGTIDTEPDYLSFLESLKMPAEKPVLEVSGPIAQPTTTPLLEHLRLHGRTGKKGKDKSAATTSSSDATARRAIASVNAAAAKRAPNASNGPLLVAGKGREVITAATTPNATDGTPSGGTEGKKKRNRNKDKDKAKAARTAVNGDNLEKQAPPTQTQGSAIKISDQSRQARSDWAPSEVSAAKVDGEGTGTGKSGRGGRGGARGGGRGGKTEGKERTAKATVTSILTKNAEGDKTQAEGGSAGRGKGRGRGRGRGRGGGELGVTTVTPAAASARIDG